MEEKSKTILVEREIYPEIIKWLEEPEIIAINGPRQSGKTTLLLKLKETLRNKKTVYVNFEDTEALADFHRAPKSFISLHLTNSGEVYFLFDEFQYVENGEKSLKLLYDAFPRIKFIITGSSSLRIREIASYLVGRVVFFDLYPFSFAEFLSYKKETLFNLWKKNNAVFDAFLKNRESRHFSFIFEDKLGAFFKEYLTFGGYPAVVTARNEIKKERLASLVETYIEKDIIRYLQIGNFLEFKNFNKSLAVRNGNLINYSSLSSDTSLSFREIKKFLEVLENTFVIKLISPFFSNKMTEIKKSPKIYFLDLGLRNTLLSDFREIDFRQDKGAMVENFVFQNLFFRKKNEQDKFLAD